MESILVQAFTDMLRNRLDFETNSAMQASPADPLNLHHNPPETSNVPCASISEIDHFG